MPCCLASVAGDQTPRAALRSAQNSRQVRRVGSVGVHRQKPQILSRRSIDRSSGSLLVSTIRWGEMGISYGLFTPVMFGISPDLAFLYSPLISRASQTATGVLTWRCGLRKRYNWISRNHRDCRQRNRSAKNIPARQFVFRFFEAKHNIP